MDSSHIAPPLCGGVVDAFSLSTKGRYGAAITCSCCWSPSPDKKSPELGRLRCCSCNLSSDSPTTWYLSQLIGGHRTTFCAFGNFPNLLVSEARWSFSIGPSVISSSESSRLVMPDGGDLDNLPALRFSAKLSGSLNAAAFMVSSARMSRKLCSRWSCKIEMAARKAIASELSSRLIGSGSGSSIQSSGGRES